MENISSFKDIGIAVAAVVVMGYVVLKIIMNHKETTNQLLTQLNENRKDYTAFVSENNHTNTELTRTCTSTMIEVKNSIENHNKVLEKLIDKLDK